MEDVLVTVVQKQSLPNQPKVLKVSKYYTTEAARGLGVLVEVGFSLILLNQGVWGAGRPTAGGETGRFLRTKTALEASKPHYFAKKFPKICNNV